MAGTCLARPPNRQMLVFRLSFRAKAFHKAGGQRHMGWLLDCAFDVGSPLKRIGVLRLLYFAGRGSSSSGVLAGSRYGINLISDMLKGSDKGWIIGVIPSFPPGTTLTPLQIIMEPGEVLIFRAMPFLEGSVLGLPILPLWDGLSITFLGGVLNLVF